MGVDAGGHGLPAQRAAGRYKQLADATQRLHSKDLPALKVNMPPTLCRQMADPAHGPLHEGVPGGRPQGLLPTTPSTSIATISTLPFAMAAAIIRACIPSCLSVEVIPVCSPELLAGPAALKNASDLKAPHLAA
ncbi:hypothetical protein ACU4GD_32205 [Cupriavidus basilensis]